MVLQHHLGDGLLEGDALQHVVPRLCVPLDEVELVLAEPARLGEDLRGHGDLAHVVDEGGEPQAVEFAARHPHP